MVPHAPLLLHDVAGRDVAPAVTEAVSGLTLPDADVIVLASPHGNTTGVYATARGDLDSFGPRGVTVHAASDEAFARALAARWGRPLLDGRADHGVVVPLRLLRTGDVPVVAAAFAEGLGVDAAIKQANALVAALGAAEESVVFVASVNTSAGLTDRAPFPSLPGAPEAEAAVLDALQADAAGVVAHLPALAAAGSCAAGPLAAFALLCRDRPCRMLAYDHPVGVGYPVAVTA